MSTTAITRIHHRPHSVAEQWAAMPTGERETFIASLTNAEAEAFLYEWEIFARPEQIPSKDGSWFGYMMMAGRGSGKTRAGAEFVRDRVKQGFRYIALVGETAADVRDVMVEGESGILAISPPGERPKYEPSKRRLVWPHGAIAICYSGKEPDQLRGPQHDTAWADEIAKWQYAQEAWDNLEMGLRLGSRPQVFITTTPRPIPIIKGFLKDPQVITVTGTSYDNLANLADTFIERVIRKYEGTRLGEQEIHAKVLGDVPGALWTQEMIENNRISAKDLPAMIRIAVGVDVAVTHRKTGKMTSREEMDAITREKIPNETGIFVVGLGKDPASKERTIYLLNDASGEMTPEKWGKRVVQQFKTWGASRVVAERNQGGDMIESTIRVACNNLRIPMLPYRSPFSMQSKSARAEPIAALTEQGLVKFVGQFPALEDQLTLLTSERYLGPGSPDRADAMVSAATELTFGAKASNDPNDYPAVQK
jgi:phage terminase large subunit-like protein